MRWPSFSKCKFPFSSWAEQSAAATQQTKSVSKFHHLFRKYLIKKIIGNFTKQINEVGAKFVIVDKETIESVKEACKGVHHSVQYLSVGEKVPGTVSFEDFLQDDGSGKLKRKRIFL